MPMQGPPRAHTPRNSEPWTQNHSPGLKSAQEKGGRQELEKREESEKEQIQREVAEMCDSIRRQALRAKAAEDLEPQRDFADVDICLSDESSFSGPWSEAYNGKLVKTIPYERHLWRLRQHQTTDPRAYTMGTEVLFREDPKDVWQHGVVCSLEPLHVRRLNDVIGYTYDHIVPISSSTDHRYHRGPISSSAFFFPLPRCFFSL